MAAVWQHPEQAGGAAVAGGIGRSTQRSTFTNAEGEASV